MQPDYRLYHYQPSGNSYKIRLLLHQLGIVYERKEVDIVQGESRTQAFLQINPNGRVPVLQHGDNYLPESNAALWYLAQHTALLPDDKFAMAQVLQWMFFEQYSHEPNIATLIYWIHILNKEQTYQEKIAEKRVLGYAALDVMEQHLAKTQFFVANAYSIADIALYAYTHRAAKGKFDLSAYANIRAWLSRVESTPNFISIHV